MCVLACQPAFVRACVYSSLSVSSFLLLYDLPYVGISRLRYRFALVRKFATIQNFSLVLMIWQRSLQTWRLKSTHTAACSEPFGGCEEESWCLGGGDVAQLVRASDRHATDAGSIPRCGKGFFSQSHLSVQTLLRVSLHPRVQSHALTYVCTLKILWSMSEFGELCKHENTQHAQ